MLIIIVVWAVAAVLMLTGTLVAAHQIDDRVNDDIVKSVPEIDQDTDNVKLAAETSRIAARILPAVDGISDQLDEVHEETVSINDTVGAPRRGGTHILGTARRINGTVRRIESTVVGRIGPTVQGIGATVGSIGAHVGSIHASVRSIRASGGGILATARSIERGVAAINARADRGIATVGGIAQDLDNVLHEVGPGHEQLDEAGRFAGGASIHGHANSIDCRIQALTTIPVVGTVPGAVRIVDPVTGIERFEIAVIAPSQYCNR